MSNIEYDAVVIGGGFKGMMTSYGLMKQGLSVCLIEKGKELGGFMSPMFWQGVAIDKGPQYLDGVSEAHKLILDDVMGEREPLESLNYSYGSFWNGKYTDGFAIPDYRTLSKKEKAAVLFESLSALSPQTISNQLPDAESIADLFSDESETSYLYIKQWCNKFLQADSKTLSPLNRSLATFFGRKLLLDNELSLRLKETPLMDDILAANKVGIDHKTHNLYPLNKNLGYFKDAFVKTLENSSVQICNESDVVSVSRDGNCYELKFSNQQSVFAKSVYCAATIESTENTLLNTNTISAYVKPVAQIFYLLEIDLDKPLPFYIMNYSQSTISRVTNFTAYANKPDNGKSILCVEVPTIIDSEIWNEPESHYKKLMIEIGEMGIKSNAICNHQAFKVPSTYRTLLCGYEQQLQKVSDDIADKLGESVHILTPHLLTRASIMADLSTRGILK